MVYDLIAITGQEGRFTPAAYNLENSLSFSVLSLPEIKSSGGNPPSPPVIGSSSWVLMRS